MNRRDRLAGLLQAAREAHVSVEIAPIARRPGELPAHPLAVGLELLDRRPRHRDQRHVSGLQVRDHAVKSVRDRGVHRAAGLVARAEHEVVDQKLRAAVEQLRQRLLAVSGLERVLLLDPHPGKLLGAGGRASSPIRVCSFSRSSSTARAACHSCRVAVLWAVVCVFMRALTPLTPRSAGPRPSPRSGAPAPSPRPPANRRPAIATSGRERRPPRPAPSRPAMARATSLRAAPWGYREHAPCRYRSDRAERRKHSHPGRPAGHATTG